VTRRDRDACHYALLGPGRVGELPRPLSTLPAGWVRVRIAYCGVCGSDVSRYSGQRAAAYPVSLGHEWVGVVEGLGSDVRALALGDVVTTDLNHRCGTCPSCLSGRSHLCRRGQKGWFSNRGFATLVDLDAGYLQRCQKAPAPHLALAEPVSCVLHAVGHCRLTPADRPLVIGAGGLGLCTAFVLCHTMHVAGFDVTDRDPTRLARLTEAVGPVGRAAAVPADTYDVVLDMSGTVSGLQEACERLAPGGRLCTMSRLPDDADVGLLKRLGRKDATVTISYLNGPSTTLTHAIRLLEQAWSPRWDTLLDIRPLDDLPAVLEGRSTSPANKVVIDVDAAAAGSAAQRPQPLTQVV
jgi:(R,R)-butanediol dehydrogenase/meso-butanediol dehydrogenase/diacetyl reductase